MFCGKCGKNINDDAKFCPYCGAATGEQDTLFQPPSPSQPPVTDPPYTSQMNQSPAPAGGKEKKGFTVLAAIGGAAVVAVIAAVVLFSGILSGSKGALAKALVKSSNAYQTAAEAAGMADIHQLTKDKKTTQEISLRIKNISDELNYYYPDLSMLEGIGFSVTEGFNLPDKKMDLSASVTYGSTDILSAWINADDDTVTFGSPQFLGSSAYGFNTETLGKDLAKLGGVPDELSSISFNIFDILNGFDGTIEVDKAALKELTDSIKVEKGGKETIEVNGHDTNCTLYHVQIPMDAMRTYLSAAAAAYQNRSSNEALMDLLESLGMSADELALLSDSEESFGLLDEAVKSLGDLELDIYVNGGYIMAAKWSKKIEGTRIDFSLYLGGGKNYTDDLSLELTADRARITLTSTGDHSASGGTFTDESSLTIRDGSDAIKVTSEISWDAKKNADNFTWSVKSSGFTLKASGALTTTKDSMSLELDKLAANALGTDLVTFSGSYSVKPYAAPQYTAKSPTMLASMDMDDFEALYEDVSINTQNWLYDLMAEIPELAYMFW